MKGEEERKRGISLWERNTDCSDQELNQNWWPIGAQDDTHPTKPHRSGQFC